jgi:hypothetical protein
MIAVAVRTPVPHAQGPRTRAEASAFRETSRYDDVIAYLRAVDAASELVTVTSFGTTFEGRSLPLAIVGRVDDPAAPAIRADGKLRIYLQANVHAGEVDGKEAVLALIRDLALGAAGSPREWLDSMVLLVAPLYNADGNERISTSNRPLQHGPVGGMGIRTNAQGLNINRDYIKLETPEGQSMARLLNDYDPHVMMDLHTTNGSRHAYHLTYAAPSNPAVEPTLLSFAQDAWLPAVVRSIKSKYGWDYQVYGNVEGSPPDRVWLTVEDLPRYSHNYWGLRNRFGILSESYSYATFEERIAASRRFVEEVLAFAHTNADRIKRITAEADARRLNGRRLSLRSRVKPAAAVEILMGDTVEEPHPETGRPMLRRLDVRKPEPMRALTAFESTESERVPSAYFVPADQAAVVQKLRAHGIRIERLERAATMRVEEFEIASNQAAAQAFENHRERTVTGRYLEVERSITAGTWRVPMDQPLARLAFYLLEPRSNDSLLTWNFFDESVAAATAYPILRTIQ